MTNPLLLYIDCAVQFSSVAIARGDQLLALQETDRINAAAEELHVFINHAVVQSGVSIADLQGVCISGGPGSYTGLRIATAAAKGICFALGIPLMQVNTLEMMVFGAIFRYRKAAYTNYIPMIDARRMEVFSATYVYKNGRVAQLSAPGPLIISETEWHALSNLGDALIFGNGAFKCSSISRPGDITIWDDYKPSAADLIQPSQLLWSEKQFEDTTYYEPNYLKAYHFK
jgi:tRNA threonylcarbamoyladenosine biosynthesis protein TsaB